MNTKNRMVLVFCTIFLTLFCFKISANASSLMIGENITRSEMRLFADESCEGTYNDILGCSTNPNNPMYWLSLALDIIRYTAIIALLGLSIADFAKAIISNDKDALKKASTKTLKRFIYCVILFFLPIVIDFALDLFQLDS